MKTWKAKTLGELCDIELGKTPARANKAYWDEARETSNVWLSIADLSNVDANLVFDSKEYLSAEGASISKKVRIGTLLVSFKLTLGRLAFAGRELFTNEAIAALSILDERELSRKFLFYFLHFFDWDRATEGDAKIKGKTLNKAKLKQMEIRFPAPSEQNRIVGFLDESFEGIAVAKANARQNLQNARTLFESHLQSLFAEGGDGWENTTVGDQVTLQRGFDITKVQQSRGDVPVVSSGGIKSFHDKAMVNGPGVVIGRKGTLGKVFYLEAAFWPHDTTLWVRDFKGNDPRFVYYFFTGLNVRHLDSGTANPALNRNQVHPIGVRWPSVSLQRTIVATFDSLRAKTQYLESIYQNKCDALDALKQSLLHRVFTGQF